MKIILSEKLIKKIIQKKLSKYVAAFDYIDKTLIVLSATTGGVSIFPFTNVVGAPVWIASASFTLIFSLTTGIVKKLLSVTRNKKRKHDKILILAKSKLSNIEALISQALIDMEISHEKFIAIFKEKDKYEKMKENLKCENEKQEIMRLSCIKSKTSEKNNKKLLHILCHQKILFFLFLYKMVVKISKNKRKSCGIEAIYNYNEEKIC